MNQEYSLGGDIVTVGSGGSLDSMVKGTIGAHYNLALGAIVVLALVIVFLLFIKKESYNPTRLARMQTVSLSGSEAMSDGTSLHKMWSELDCNKNKAVGDDAWGWMYGQATNASVHVDPIAVAQGMPNTYTTSAEGFGNPGKVSDSKLSAIASGY